MSEYPVKTITVLSAAVLAPLIIVSVVAYWKGAISFVEYVALWREPAALLFGFWLRDLKE